MKGFSFELVGLFSQNSAHYVFKVSFDNFVLLSVLNFFNFLKFGSTNADFSFHKFKLHFGFSESCFLMIFGF